MSGNCAGAPNASGHNLIGHLTRVKNSVAMTDYPWYDAMGRVLQNEQSFGGGTPYVFSYTYNDAGLKTMHYPSGRTLTYGYDAGARVISVSGQMGSEASPYVSNANYTAWGAMEDLTLASGHWEQICYNSRMQPVGMLLRTQAPVSGCPASGNQLQLTLGYADGINNGNLRSQTISDGAAWSVAQTYDYDALNRLWWAQEAGAAGWKQTYEYDQWGNRWVDPGQSNGIALDGNTPQAGTWFTGKNRLSLG